MGRACNSSAMRTPIAISPSLFALLLLASSGIATAVATTVASSLPQAPPPICAAPETTAAITVDPLQPVLQAAIEAELGLGDDETLDPAKVARTAHLYRFYVDEHARLHASGSLSWARSRATSFEQLRADMDEMYALERQARELEDQAKREDQPKLEDPVGTAAP